MWEVDDETVVNMIDQNDEEEGYINPEDELLDENDVIVLEEHRTLDFDGTTTSNNEQEVDYDYPYDDLFFEELLLVECNDCDELVVEE